jgi:hypothetical protein
MWDKVKTLLASWKTTATGLLAVACGAGEYFGLLPDKYAAIAPAVCTILVGLGLVAAKDGDKSHAPVPADAPKTTA